MQRAFIVIVGNIGTVYSGPNGFYARQSFEHYKRKSKRGEGQGANEPVTLMRNDEIRDEYIPITQGDME